MGKQKFVNKGLFHFMKWSFYGKVRTTVDHKSKWSLTQGVKFQSLSNPAESHSNKGSQKRPYNVRPISVQFSCCRWNHGVILWSQSSLDLIQNWAPLRPRCSSYIPVTITTTCTTTMAIVIGLYTAQCGFKIFGVLLEYPNTTGFQCGHLKNGPYTYTVSGGNSRVF